MLIEEELYGKIETVAVLGYVVRDEGEVVKNFVDGGGGGVYKAGNLMVGELGSGRWGGVKYL